ncbi:MULTISPECIES: hypothetical protein [unclassified Bradyrhizobium]|uniref:hypothetical protein n=1 Tax=unclassified Bradyrhizobium TaxID=2631580 RepID=UPI001BA52291|nr:MULTISPECIES: hypothetical protein [unclassified Bradyrhizobium]MBR1207095.1 hypothetical protein [Bradyrhizobium sp. AUGA SZCCT0124]MBR1313634.1 hypothetical protein [Bradyrhizobium sp. AUGA SZCCT0051]MBR1343269.1 hypothetical protein [Bradyrhizobium sp. AUGA SZCCT0105]MBR1357311.1 hypothetical protein [Bradyrhizobium sp. AUGA SZCCT0045]
MTLHPGLLRREVYDIGLIAIHWSYLEHTVESLIWAILEVKAPTGRALTADIQMRARMKMLRKLIDARHPPMSEVFKNLQTTVQNLEQDRNLIVHGIWGRDYGSEPSATSLRRNSASPDLVYGEHFPRARMKEIDTNIISTSAYVYTLKGVIEDAIAASRKKSETPADPHPSTPDHSPTEPDAPPKS